MKPEAVHTDSAPPAVGPYSQAIRIGGFLYTSGSIGMLPDGSVVEGVRAQAEQMFRNLGEILKAGGAGFDNVVKATCYLTDMDDFQEFNEVYASWFGEHRPARTTVEVSRLPKDVLVEVELVAYTD